MQELRGRCPNLFAGTHADAMSLRQDDVIGMGQYNDDCLGVFFYTSDQRWNG